MYGDSFRRRNEGERSAKQIQLVTIWTGSRLTSFRHEDRTVAMAPGSRDGER